MGEVVFPLWVIVTPLKKHVAPPKTAIVSKMQ